MKEKNDTRIFKKSGIGSLKVLVVLISEPKIKYKGYFPFKYYYNVPQKIVGRGRFGPWLPAEEYCSSDEEPHHSQNTFLPCHHGFWKTCSSLHLGETLPLWGLSFGRKILPIICSEARLWSCFCRGNVNEIFYLKKLLSLCFHMCADLITHVITQSRRRILLSFAF